MSSALTPYSIPPLLGGYPLKRDLAPSIIFSALYALLLPLIFYRLYRKATRTSVLSSVAALVIERSIVFGLRAAVSPEPISAEGFEESEGLMEYMQTTLFMGIVPATQDLARLVRTLLVNATYGSEAIKDIPHLQEYLPSSGSDAVKIPSRWRDDCVSVKSYRTKSLWSFSGTTVVEDASGDYPDQPRLRFWVRRMHNVMSIAFAVIFVTGLLGNCRLIQQRNDPTKLKENEILRYVSTALSVFVLISINSMVIWALVYMPRLNRKATKYVFLVSAFLVSTFRINLEDSSPTLVQLVPAVYRFTVMAQRTSTYWSSESSAQNGVKHKTLFYVIGILPEWLAVFICLSIDVRKVFQTGKEGDTRWWDETPAEKEKRLLREKEKAMKRGDGLISVPVISRLSRGRFALPLISS